MKLKVLPLCSSQKYYLEDMQELENFTGTASEIAGSIQPVFNRNGWYLQIDDKSKKCWFEVDGLAFSSRPEDFEFALESFESKILSDSEVKTLKAIILNRMLSKHCIREARKKLMMHYHLCDLRNIRRSWAFSKSNF